MRFSPLRPLGLVLVFVFIACATSGGIPGEIRHGRENYIEYHVGDLPIILTAGHGGDLTPTEIPDRLHGTTVTDLHTRELAIACHEEIFALTGKRPHLILSHLSRRKLDPNREILEAAQGDPAAEQAWREFHGFIAAARAATRAEHGFGYLVDLHGHGHAIVRLELGYGLGADELNQTDAALNQSAYGWQSTLRPLLLARPDTSFSSLLRGPGSLGDLFNQTGVPAWPSPDFPSPGASAFFGGGHTVRAHSCPSDHDSVHGVQIEAPYEGIRDTPASRADFASRFARVLKTYLSIHYAFDLGASADEAGGEATRAVATIHFAATPPRAASFHHDRGGSLAIDASGPDSDTGANEFPKGPEIASVSGASRFPNDAP